MATRKRPKLDKNKRLKAIARERVGSPKPARIIEEKPKRPKAKYKLDWTQAEE
jgi:hypothetical protein